MKHTIVTAFATTLLFVACNNDANKTADAKSTDSTGKTEKMEGANDKKETAWVPVDSAAAEKNWMAYMTPGEPQAMLAKANGTWTGTVSMWMKPGAPPMTSTTTSVNKMIMGGRYQVSNHTGNMMGQPFEGMSTTGYDNAKKVFVSSWVDNMGTGLMKMEGPWDEATKSITFTGKMVDATRGGEEVNLKEIFKIVDDNNQVLEMYGPDPATGKEFKTMEIKYTRKK